MQLSAGLVQFFAQPSLKNQAEKMQTGVLTAVPKEMQELVSDEWAKIGKILADNYEALSNPGNYARFAHGNGAVEEALKQAYTPFGKEKPTREQQGLFCDTFILRRMVHESPKANPYKSLALSNWWQQLTTRETQNECFCYNVCYNIINIISNKCIIYDKLYEFFLSR